jgi:ribosomal protein L11 methylase PrmA
LAKNYPAVEVAAPGDLDLLLAIADDFSPTGVEERDDGVRVFFSSPAARDAALTTLASRFRAEPIDVSDEDWARRSQEHLPSVTVGRITIFPSPEHQASNLKSPDRISIVIAPSMGFGTGHHATTRLCLAALQTIDLDGKTELDVGTGSGVLAIAADRLGAARAVGIDIDPDAIQSANENLLLNPEAQRVSFHVADITAADFPPGNSDVLSWIRPSAAPAARASANARASLAGVGPREHSRMPRGRLRVTALSRGEAQRAEQQRRGWGPAAIKYVGPHAKLIDIVVGNLTGALIVRAASTLRAAARGGGPLIVSGLQADERDRVCDALAPAPIVWEREEDGWVALILQP